MVYATTLLEYEFTNIEQYFDYIVDSKLNGQYSQVVSLIKKLSKDQKKDFIKYLDDFYTGNGENVKYCKNLTMELL